MREHDTRGSENYPEITVRSIKQLGENVEQIRDQLLLISGGAYPLNGLPDPVIDVEVFGEKFRLKRSVLDKMAWPKAGLGFITIQNVYHFGIIDLSERKNLITLFDRPSDSDKIPLLQKINPPGLYENQLFRKGNMTGLRASLPSYRISYDPKTILDIDWVADVRVAMRVIPDRRYPDSYTLMDVNLRN